MIIPYTKIVHSPIVELKTQQQLGTVHDVIIQKSDLSIYGFIVRTSWLSTNNKYISIDDIIQLEQGTIIVTDDSALIEREDALRLRKAISKGYCGLNQRVVTRSGKKIGLVYDYLISDSDYKIDRLYIKNLLSERIIPRSAVRSYEKKTIVIDDDFAAVSTAANTAYSVLA